MSAFWMTEISSLSNGIAVRIAAPLPRFSCRRTTMPLRPVHSSRTAAVPSVDPSSTTTTCFSRSSSSTRRSTSAIVAASLYAGTMNETRGPALIRTSSRLALVRARDRIPRERRDRADDQPDQRADGGRVAVIAHGRLHRERRRDDGRRLDVLCLSELQGDLDQIVLEALKS